MKYIRDYYKVPAKRGGRIEYDGDDMRKFLQGFMYRPVQGTILGASGPSLRVRFDNEQTVRVLHPTWKVKYL